jgi:hypothetical protein
MGFRLSAQLHYARALGCALDELGDFDTFVQDPDVLDHLAATYPHTIAAYAEDHS